jgi:hypothetical protein
MILSGFKLFLPRNEELKEQIKHPKLKSDLEY